MLAFGTNAFDTVLVFSSYITTNLSPSIFTISATWILHRSLNSAEAIPYIPSPWSIISLWFSSQYFFIICGFQ